MSLNEEGKIADDQFKNKGNPSMQDLPLFVCLPQMEKHHRASLWYIHAINTDQGEVRTR